ncbi:MAG TPA: TIR domain-containing protein [Candidatus Baltobacteraceae bacterium]|jgi:DNA-binding MarR family transcriptional regulator
MKDDLRFAILAELRRRQEGGRSEYEWAAYTDIATALKTALDHVLQQCDELVRDGFIEVRSGANRSGARVRVTTSGRDYLEQWLKDQDAAASDLLLSSEPVKKYQCDLFVSHASEDATYIDPIVATLEAGNIKVWYDRNLMQMGAKAFVAMNEGVTESRSFLIFASPEYFKKHFAKNELGAILHLNSFDKDRRIIVVLYGMSQADLRRDHAMLSTHTNIDSALLSGEDIVRAVVHELLTGQELPPPKLETDIEPGPRAVAQLEPSIYVPNGHNPPYDVLDDTGITKKPTLEIQWFTPGFVDHTFSIKWSLRNTGSTTAQDVAVFMPGLKVYRVTKLEPGVHADQCIRFDDRYAYFEIMKQPVSAVIEFSDSSDRIYRQYATVNAFPKWNENEAEYLTTELGYPYRVSNRIVTIDDNDRFHRSRSIGWPRD